MKNAGSEMLTLSLALADGVKVPSPFGTVTTEPLIRLPVASTVCEPVVLSVGAEPGLTLKVPTPL